MTQRIFKLKGTLPTGSATGKVSINSTEVFNGAFTVGSMDEPDGFLCEFIYTFDDSAGTDTVLPVEVTVFTGQADVGMFKYNYALIANPQLTSDELVYVTNGTTADAPSNVQADVRAKGGWYVPDETVFDYGNVPEVCEDNRTNMVIDGVTLAPENSNRYIPVAAGSALTFDTIVFSSVNLITP